VDFWCNYVAGTRELAAAVDTGTHLVERSDLFERLD